LKNFTIRFVEKKFVAKDKVALVFDAKDSGFTFEAGQYAHFTLSSAKFDDDKGYSRPLSIANAPSMDERLMIVVRDGNSLFSQNLMALDVNDVVIVGEALGGMKLPEDKSIPVVIIAGGTGITPVRSIVEDHINKSSERNILVIYANKSLAESAFINDFRNWEKLNSGLRLVPVFEDTKEAEGFFEKGYVTTGILKKHIANFSENFFYLFGPPPMVDSVKEILESSGVESDRIFSEQSG
jgi:propane monooxygenase reductase subunit